MLGLALFRGFWNGGLKDWRLLLGYEVRSGAAGTPCALLGNVDLDNYMIFVIIVHAVYVRDMMGREYNDYLLIRARI